MPAAPQRPLPSPRPAGPPSSVATPNPQSRQRFSNPFAKFLRGTAVWLLSIGLALCIGAATGIASQALTVAGLYEVVAALTLAIGVVAICHALNFRPPIGYAALAVIAATAWLGAHRTASAYGFRQQQAQAIAQESELLTEDFLISGAQTPLDLVDAGFMAETGTSGIRAALLIELRAGFVVHRALHAARVLPLPLWAHALALAIEAAFVAFIVRRALGNLLAEPVCPVCATFLRRTVLGAVDAAEVTRLAQAWSDGDRALPDPTTTGNAVALVYSDSCRRGHCIAPGLAMVRTRRRGFSWQVPGPLAQIAPVAKLEGGARPS